MKLPNVDRAIVARDKIVDYLLSAEHPVGKYKAAWFARFGVSAERWEEAAQALLDHAREHDVRREEDSPFGVYYIVDGALHTPDGRNPAVRAVWFIRTGERFPRFVTAHPARPGA